MVLLHECGLGWFHLVDGPLLSWNLALDLALGQLVVRTATTVAGFSFSFALVEYSSWKTLNDLLLIKDRWLPVLLVP